MLTADLLNDVCCFDAVEHNDGSTRRETGLELTTESGGGSLGFCVLHVAPFVTFGFLCEHRVSQPGGGFGLRM